MGRILFRLRMRPTKVLVAWLLALSLVVVDRLLVLRMRCRFGVRLRDAAGMLLRLLAIRFRKNNRTLL